jgi:hypothetical protein
VQLRLRPVYGSEKAITASPSVVVANRRTKRTSVAESGLLGAWLIVGTRFVTLCAEFNKRRPQIESASDYIICRIESDGKKF